MLISQLSRSEDENLLFPIAEGSVIFSFFITKDITFDITCQFGVSDYESVYILWAYASTHQLTEHIKGIAFCV